MATSITLRLTYDGPLPDGDATAEMLAEELTRIKESGQLPTHEHKRNGNFERTLVEIAAWPTREGS